MKTLLVNLKQPFMKIKNSLMIFMFTSFTSLQALADGDETKKLGSIPVDKTGHDAIKEGGKIAGDWIALIKGYIGQGAALLGLGVSIVAFIWISYAAIAKFNECRTNRAEWSELGLLVIAGAALLVFIALLVTMSKDIIGTDFTKINAK